MTQACEARCAQLPSQAADWLAELRVSRVYLNPDQRYLGSCIAVSRRHVVELTDLPPAEREAFWRDIEQVAQAVRNVTHPHKLNIAMLGNLVPHLHAHIIARQPTDAAWPNAIWSMALPPVLLSPIEKTKLGTELRMQLTCP